MEGGNIKKDKEENCPVCKVGKVKYVMHGGFPYWECSNCDYWDYGDEEDITYEHAPSCKGEGTDEGSEGSGNGLSKAVNEPES